MKKDAATDMLALQLGFYLASWGMYRGSGGLLQKNHLIHEGAVKIICSDRFKRLRCCDQNEVSEELIQLILKLKKELAAHYNSIQFIRGGQQKNISDTDTLLSKILLGTLACVPAYDRYFLAGLKAKGASYSCFDQYSLKEIFDFIEINDKSISDCQKSIKKANYYYSQMKIMDMYFWQIGFDADKKKGKTAVS